MGRRGRRSAGPKIKARKKVTVKLIEREHNGKVTTPYRLMEECIREHHHHLIDAKIAIGWRLGKKADADGRLWLGQAKKGSDLDRTLHGYDFVILLNHEAWNSSWFTEAMMAALIDHELCHCTVANDSNGEPKTDEEGRTVYRIRKHDLEEFRDVVARHGQWKDDIREFVTAATRDQQEASDRPLLKQAEQAEANGHVSNGQANGHASPGDWRTVALETLFSGGTLKALNEADLRTLGDLNDFTDSGCKLTEIEGIGPGKASNIAERLEQFWREHPEYAEAAAAS